jgi:hypothetical protein
LGTILDALRKAERETAQRAQQPGSLSDMPLARVLAEKRNRRVFRQLVIVVTILFFAGTGVTIMFGHRALSSEVNVSPSRVAEVRRKDKGFKTSTVPVRQREETSKLRNAVKNPNPEPERLVTKEESFSLPSKNDTALPVMAKPLQKRSSQIPTRALAAIGARSSEVSIPELELKAIVWAEDPKSCSAMINGRLVGSGEQVGGFTVVDIGRDHVSVKSGPRSGKLRMVGAR